MKTINILYLLISTSLSFAQSNGIVSEVSGLFEVAVKGVSTGSNGIGIQGQSVSSYGILGLSGGGRGVYGRATSTNGVTYGVLGRSDSPDGFGVHGTNTSVNGTAIGVWGKSVSPDGMAIFGENTSTTGNAVGVLGRSSSSDGFGVYGDAFGVHGFGVHGRATGTYGIGTFTETSGQYGKALLAVAYGTNGIAVSGYSVNGIAVSGDGALFDFYASGPGTNYGASSSRRWKREVVNIENALEKIGRLRGVYFTWDKEHGGSRDIGFIAEEIGEVVPEIVAYESNGIDAIGLDYSKITPLILEAFNRYVSLNDARFKTFENKFNQLLENIEILQNELNQLKVKADYPSH